jgi:hypothetical protein
VVGSRWLGRARPAAASAIRSSVSPRESWTMSRDALISAEMARRDYGVVLTASGGVDLSATETERHRRSVSSSRCGSVSSSRCE